MFSSWKRLVHVIACTSTFVWNLRAHWRNRLANQACKLKDGPLSNEEFHSAEKMWVKDLQTGLKNHLSKGEFNTSWEGILRVDGRVEKAPSIAAWRSLGILVDHRAFSSVDTQAWQQQWPNQEVLDNPSTWLLEEANLVNERPIARIPDDPEDSSYLELSIITSFTRTVPSDAEPTT